MMAIKATAQTPYDFYRPELSPTITRGRIVGLGGGEGV